MVTLLYIIGVIILIISGIAGLYSGSFIGFLISIAGGFATTIIFFALAKILDNQETILYALANQKEKQRKHLIQEKKICSKCNKEYDFDYGSCPHCGYRG